MINYILFYTGIIGTAVFLFLTIFIYFKSDIGEVLGDLTGYSAKKRSNYTNSKVKMEEPLKKRMGMSVIKVKKSKIARETERLSNLEETNFTTENACETELIDPVENCNETVLLSNHNLEETVLLDEDNLDEDSFFQIKKNILIIHSDEAI